MSVGYYVSLPRVTVHAECASALGIVHFDCRHIMSDRIQDRVIPQGTLHI